MSILLSNSAGGATLTLPDALNWSDEFWSPVMQSKTFTSTGAMLIEEAIKQSGRPYTLEGSEDTTWCTRDIVKTLQAWASTPGALLTLTIRGTAHPVTWDHERGALQGLPVVFFDDGSVADSDFYVPTLRLIGI